MALTDLKIQSIKGTGKPQKVADAEGNMIAAESVSQLQKLRALMLADLQSKEA
jgi:hypothetical protein